MAEFVELPSKDGGHYTIPLAYLGAMLDMLRDIAVEGEEPLETIARVGKFGEKKDGREGV